MQGYRYNRAKSLKLWVISLVVRALQQKHMFISKVLVEKWKVLDTLLTILCLHFKTFSGEEGNGSETVLELDGTLNMVLWTVLIPMYKGGWIGQCIKITHCWLGGGSWMSSVCFAQLASGRLMWYFHDESGHVTCWIDWGGRLATPPKLSEEVNEQSKNLV